jgi:catechol 2,3-dioxygenase-like lactoylglutathione lyase family enzyme
LLHHISIGVADLTVSGSFYDAVLAPLGYVRVWEDIRPGEQHQAIGYGLPGGGDKLALKHRNADQLHPGPGFHLALTAPSQQAVDEFHAVGIAHGAIDRGGPKLWSEFGDTYYAAYLIDPDGWQLEAVHK